MNTLPSNSTRLTTKKSIKFMFTVYFWLVSSKIFIYILQFVSECSLNQNVCDLNMTLCMNWMQTTPYPKMRRSKNVYECFALQTSVCVCVWSLVLAVSHIYHFRNFARSLLCVLYKCVSNCFCCWYTLAYLVLLMYKIYLIQTDAWVLMLHTTAYAMHFNVS